MTTLLLAGITLWMLIGLAVHGVIAIFGKDPHTQSESGGRRRHRNVLP